VELLVVVAILAVIVALITPNIVGKRERANRVKATADIATIENLLDQFYLDVNRYPTTDEGLRVLYFAPEDDAELWQGPYSKKPIGNDPWGNPYFYESPGSHSDQPYEVASFGKDGQEGGEEDDADVISWVEMEEGM
jgi:general secretion pathway protein G